MPTIGVFEIVILLIVLIPLVLLVAAVGYALVLLIRFLRRADRRLEETPGPEAMRPDMR